MFGRESEQEVLLEVMAKPHNRLLILGPQSSDLLLGHKLNAPCFGSMDAFLQIAVSCSRCLMNGVLQDISDLHGANLQH